MAFGERAGGFSARIEAISAQLCGAQFDAVASPEIIQSMWEKWVFLATLAASTCLMRAPVGDIIAAPGGQKLLLDLFDEARAIATANGFAPGEAVVARAQAMFTEAGSTITASMLRDLENGARIEADHVVGDLIARAEGAKGAKGAQGTVGTPIFSTAYTHLKAYESRRERGDVKAS
jgi:2-dehydropantoate 2-reductase